MLAILCWIFPSVRRLSESASEAERSRDDVFARNEELTERVAWLQAELERSNQERSAAERELREVYRTALNNARPSNTSPMPPIDVPRKFGRDVVREQKAAFLESFEAHLMGDKAAS